MCLATANSGDGSHVNSPSSLNGFLFGERSIACSYSSSAPETNGFGTSTNYTREPEQRMCQTRSMSGTSKDLRIRSVSHVAAWFRTGCDEDPLTTFRQMSKCRLYLRTSDAQCFYPCLESCALHPDSRVAPVRPPMIRLYPWKGESQDPEY